MVILSPPLIMWSRTKLNVGDRNNRLSVDDTSGNHVVVEQPAIIVREATKEEFIEFYIRNYGEPRPTPIPDELFFYEVVTD